MGGGRHATGAGPIHTGNSTHPPGACGAHPTGRGGAVTAGVTRRAGGSAGNAVMIGDSVNDILAAQNARVPAIAVPFGYSDKPVESFGPDVVIDHFDELSVDMVRELIAARQGG